MKGFFWFSGDFCDWPLAVIEEIKKREPTASFSGMVNAPPYIVGRIKDRSTPIDPLFNIDQLERQWLARPFEPGRLSAYEQRFGPDTINRIIIADRMVGSGFVTGGVIAESPLTRICRDHEMRMRYIVGLLDFLFAALEETKPDYVFTVGVAGAIALSLTTACEHLGISLVRLTSTRIGKRHIIDDSPEGLAKPVERLFTRALENPHLVRGSIAEARQILADFRVRPQRPEYTQFVWRQSQSLPRIIDLAALAWRTVCRRPPEALSYPYPFEQLKWELNRYFRARRLARSSVFWTLARLEGRRYAYFPLHVDPESTTMVEAPLFTNQLAVIEALAKSLPIECLLAVKEHVPMLGKRPRDFYQRLASIPKVVLISPFENGFDIITSAELTCVITGTAGWESVLMQRPTLCLGPALYHMLGEGFVVCSELSRLSEAIRNALSIPPASDELLALYLASILEVSFDFPAETLWGNVTKKVVEDNAPITQAIATRIVELADPKRPSIRRETASDFSAIPLSPRQIP